MTRTETAGAQAAIGPPGDGHEALLRYLIAIGYGGQGARPARVTRPVNRGTRGAPATALSEEARSTTCALVADVMSTPVVAVREDASFKEITKTLAMAGVSATPVVDEHNQVRGVVSHADLLAFAAGEADRPANGPTARHLMTSPAITTAADTPVAQAARLAARHRVKRLPVVDGAGRLIGIVSRSDLLRIFLTADEVIRDRVRREVIQRRLRLDPEALKVAVSGGVVTIVGPLRPHLLPTLRREVLAVDGVVEVLCRRVS